MKGSAAVPSGRAAHNLVEVARPLGPYKRVSSVDLGNFPYIRLKFGIIGRNGFNRPAGKRR